MLVIMKIELVAFGNLEVEGRPYSRDVIIEGGRIRRRKKGPSKPLRDRFGHTPLSLLEEIPWGKPRLIVGTGADGLLPVMPEVEAEAERRGIELVALPTAEACRLLADVKPRDAYAILHVTC